LTSRLRSFAGAAQLLLGVLLGVGLSGGLALRAQQPAAPAAPGGPTLTESFGVEPSGETATLTYFNRPIVVLRARIGGRGPSDRAANAARVIDDLLSRDVTGPVGSRPIENGVVLIEIGSDVIVPLTTADIDTLGGETLDAVAAQTVTRLERAIVEAVQARRPAMLIQATALSLVGLAVGGLALWGLGRVRRTVAQQAESLAERTVARSRLADVHALRASRLLDIQRGAVTAITRLLQLGVLYLVVTFVLNRFPYTRPWGESLRSFLVTTISNLALGVAHAMPGLFTVVLILLIARFLARLIALWFVSVERGQIAIAWIHPETAQPTRRLVTGLLWVFAIVVAYPYMPGSNSDAFRGVSVFLGLMLTLGSSGVVNQVMSGFMVTFSRALRVGDYVRIGDVEGTVMQLGILSTKIRTLRLEEVTIPNAVVVSNTATNYSRNAARDGVVVSTSVTIGYDTPWRQVEAMLLAAADLTPGLRDDPKPRVLQSALEDSYVRYVLLVSLEHPETRLATLNTLHGHIQDQFNEHGVQIMSPNYEGDPTEPKIVPKQQWFAAPAKPAALRREER
jgi:small-conductance mechanosensitive channel